MEVEYQNPENVFNAKKKRKNKKALSRIKQQMEFYFSDPNLAKDRFLGKLLRESKDGFVNLSTFLTFNKIHKITENVEDIRKAVSDSNHLELSTDEQQVRRIHTWEGGINNVDDSTIYVERLPNHADYRLVKRMFERFGSVAYVSIPRFRNSKKCKGFAFVEFNDPESAKKACEGYRISEDIENDVGCALVDKSTSRENLTDNTTQRHELLMIKSEHEQGLTNIQKREKLSKKQKLNEGKITPKKLKCSTFDFRPRTLSVSGVCSSTRQCRNDTTGTVLDMVAVPSIQVLKSESIKKQKQTQKRFAFAEEEMTPKRKKSKIEDKLESRESVEHSDDVTPSKSTVKLELIDKDVKTEEHIETEASGFDDKEKSSRKRMDDSEKLKLCVLSKAEWKSLRNKYLTLQRTTMGRIKKMLLIEKQKYSIGADTLFSTPVKGEPVEDSLHYGGPSQHSSDIPKAKTEIPFQPGVIIKVKLLESEELTSDLKKQVRSAIDVAYVDAPDGCELMFLRFSNSDSASLALEKKQLDQFGIANLLTGNEETEYWEKLNKDREIRLNRQRPKIRGKDKIVAKANKMTTQKNTHIRFEM